MAGRPTLFIPEIRQTILQRLAAGVSVKDACAYAGVGETTVVTWVAIGTAYEEGRSHPRMPRKVEAREEFAAFAREYKKAQTGPRQIAVSNVIKSGRDYWKHNKTGMIRTSPPPPMTWLNLETGDLAHENPIGILPGEWEMEWSGQAWTYNAGAWQANAWYLERSDGETWGHTSRTIYEFDVKQLKELKELMGDLSLSPSEVFDQMIKELAQLREEQVNAGNA